MRPVLLSKIDLAEEFGVHVSGISQYVRRGMPVRADGKCNLEQCCRWVMSNLDPFNNNDEGSKARGHANEWLAIFRLRRSREEERDEGR